MLMTCLYSSLKEAAWAQWHRGTVLFTKLGVHADMALRRAGFEGGEVWMKTILASGRDARNEMVVLDHAKDCFGDPYIR